VSESTRRTWRTRPRRCLLFIAPGTAMIVEMEKEIVADADACDAYPACCQDVGTVALA
jgi:hypothetical protein